MDICTKRKRMQITNYISAESSVSYILMISLKGLSVRKNLSFLGPFLTFLTPINVEIFKLTDIKDHYPFHD